MAAVKTAAGLIAWYMRLCGFYGWTSFWNTFYVLPGHENNRTGGLDLQSYQRLLRQNETHQSRVSSREGT